VKGFVYQVVKEASRLLIKNFGRYKEKRGLAKEVVTKIDKAINELLVEKLKNKYPFNFLSEELGFINNKSEFTWVIDPLDGTANFAVGNPFFSISIALLHEQKPIFGLIYAPILKELYLAEEGKGSYLNGRPIEVSKISSLRKSYILYCEGGSKTNARIAKINFLVHPKVKDIRKLGSAALECAWVASGRAEGYYTLKISPWDVAAGVLLVEEAGGKVTDFKGKTWKPKKCNFIATNERIHKRLLSLINKNTT